jgi:hypothetical protein
MSCEVRLGFQGWSIIRVYVSTERKTHNEFCYKAQSANIQLLLSQLSQPQLLYPNSKHSIEHRNPIKPLPDNPPIILPIHKKIEEDLAGMSNSQRGQS